MTKRLGFVFYNGKSSALPVSENDYEYFNKADSKDLLEYELGLPYKVRPTEEFSSINTLAEKWVKMNGRDQEKLYAAILAYNLTSVDSILEWLQREEEVFPFQKHNLFTDIRSVEAVGRACAEEVLASTENENGKDILNFIDFEGLGDFICDKNNGFIVEGHGYIQRGGIF